MERTGPCISCGKSISWYDEYCYNCSKHQNDIEDMVDERIDTVEKLLEGELSEWSQSSIGIVCPKHKQKDSKKLDVEDFKDNLENVEDYCYFYLYCNHLDCEEEVEKEIPYLDYEEYDYE